MYAPRRDMSPTESVAGSAATSSGRRDGMQRVTIFASGARNDPSPAAHGESHTQFLNRVAGPYWDQVRDVMEAWFSRFCANGQADVLGRLRSKDDRQSKGAFFELYLHECLLQMGYAVTCHPELVGTTRKPDFLATKGGEQIYVEARSASSSDVLVGKAAQVNAVYDSLDRLRTPNFFLWIDVATQGKHPLSVKALRSRLEAWLESLNPDEHPLTQDSRREDLPEYVHAESGWEIRFHAIAKSVNARGREGARPLGVFGGGNATWVSDKDDFRRVLSTKGSAYGPLGAPFVVAVALSSISLDDHDVRGALYGTESIEIRTYEDGAEELVDVRAGDGYWYRGDHWDHRGVSGVLVVKNLHPAFVGRQSHTLWEHPDPEFRVPELPMWRRCIVESGNLEFKGPDRTQADWFGLSDPWPTGEPFPAGTDSS